MLRGLQEGDDDLCGGEGEGGGEVRGAVVGLEGGVRVRGRGGDVGCCGWGGRAGGGFWRGGGGRGVVEGEDGGC